MRRMVGRQRLSAVRPWVTVVLFPVLAAVLLAGAMSRPPSAGALALGLLLGAVLGIVGLRLTRFEQSDAGLFYTPNAHLGIALSLLLLLRIGYRVLQGYVGAGRGAQASAGLFSSPLTLAIFGTLAGYDVAYAIGLLRWRQRVTRGGSRPFVGGAA